MSDEVELPDAARHYADTIANRVPLKRIRPFLDNEERSELTNLYPDGLVSVWGVTPGEGDVNRKRWDRVDTGDVTLFSREGAIFTSAVVTLKTHNAALALELWQRDADGDTWEYMYFLDELRPLHVPYPQFNKIVGYRPKYVIRGFTVLDEEKSTRILDALDLWSDTHYPSASKGAYEALIEKLAKAGTLNSPGHADSRKEQSLLRKSLFGSQRQARCGICRRSFPKELLVAAHIKKREFCSKKERLDYRHIVMPMCHLGCDQLFERGFLTVVDGTINATRNKVLSNDLEDVLGKVVGQPCQSWNDGTKSYFEWHNSYHNS